MTDVHIQTYDGRRRPTTCPQCKTILTGHTSTTERPGRPPREGDLSICAYCQSLNAYTADGGLRLATEAEYQDLSPFQQGMCRLYLELGRRPQ